MSSASTISEIIVIGVVATLAIDLWQVVLHRVAGLPAANWGLVGRWVAWLARGVFFHHPITATPKVRGETIIGWAFHYAVGIAYAALYVAILRTLPDSPSMLITALALAIALLIAPWFVMQPALGLGIMARRTPNPTAVRAINVSAHSVFGLGLYIGALAWLTGVASG
jgi:hypothetical protein